ncbi:MAG: hypothetical protein NUV34_07430, partial [Sulfuricaulis sp.]|nr:hypothetical protein [Sulfuricaulis sp.]
NRRRLQGELEARDYLMQAATGRSSGRAARRGGNYGAAGDALSGAGTASSQYFGYLNNGNVNISTRIG